MPIRKFDRLPMERKEEVLKNLNSDIWYFRKWDKVLLHFGLNPLIPSSDPKIASIAIRAKFGGGSGETEDHRRLKEYVRENPDCIGLPSGAVGVCEFAFGSADRIDVLFKIRQNWVGAEVKGAKSDPADIMRGIFQCAKYKALIKATQRYEQTQLGARVILVLGQRLPPEFRKLVGLLNTEVRERVAVPKDFSPSQKCAAGAPDPY